MAIVRWDPFAEINALQQQVATLLDTGMSNQRGMVPSTDIYSQGDTLTVEAHLPGFDEKDVSVSVHEGVVEIKAEHADTQTDTARKYYVRESATSYFRRIALPKNVDSDQIAAHFADGVLKVTVPFRVTPEPKKITVTAKAPDKK